MKIDGLKRLYFVGIGGIGMSALARYFAKNGIEIFGYDKTKTVLTEQLEKEGCQIHYEDNVALLPEGVDLVIYTPAIPSSHSELAYFKRNYYPVKKRAAVLGMISKQKKCIAIGGTHGKTTTSSMTSFVLRKGGVDCSAFIGGIVKNYASNFVFGNSDWIVVEADEYDRSFLSLNPEIAVVSSVDADHLDIYKKKSLMLESFQSFVAKINEGGYLLQASGIEDDLLDGKTGIRRLRYGIKEGDYYADNIRIEEGGFVFDANFGNEKIESIKIQMVGRHNIENAMAAICVAKIVGIENIDIKNAFAEFKGIQRRFDIKVQNERTVYIDDYAHHPNELIAAIGAAKELFPGRKICGIFQPHLYSRTHDFADEFAAALDALDEVILLPIYPAREEPMEGVDSDMIRVRMKNENVRVVAKSDLLKYLENKEFEIVMSLGAGDIDVFVEPIRELLNNG